MTKYEESEKFGEFEQINGAVANRLMNEVNELIDKLESNSAPDGSYIFCADKVEVNDIVDVIFTRNNIFDWQNSCTLGDCKVVKIPYAVGDTYGFVYQDDEIQRNIFVNPISTEFIGVEFIKRAQKI